MIRQILVAGLFVAAVCGASAEDLREVTVKNGIPSDADILFDGSNLDKWRSIDGGKARWPVNADGTMTVNKEGNTPCAVLASIYTREEFSNFQLHVEYIQPTNLDFNDQWRGNSGVKIFGCYEVQILDSYRNPSRGVQACGAIYSNCAPLVNASQKPGVWQSFDIVFHAPIVENGEVKSRVRITVLHNGVLVQDNSMPPPYPDKPENRVKTSGSIELQSHNDHSTPISFRNVWIRRL